MRDEQILDPDAFPNYPPLRHGNSFDWPPPKKRLRAICGADDDS